MFSSVTDAIQQGAFRRGANMGIMRVDHPDILAFIDVKSDLTQLANYNLSVAMTDEFMDLLQHEPDKNHGVLNPHTGERGRLSKRSVWATNRKRLGSSKSGNPKRSRFLEIIGPTSRGHGDLVLRI